MREVLASLTSIGLMLVVSTMLAHDAAHKEAKGKLSVGFEMSRQRCRHMTIFWNTLAVLGRKPV